MYCYQEPLHVHQVVALHHSIKIQMECAKVVQQDALHARTLEYALHVVPHMLGNIQQLFVHQAVVIMDFMLMII